jgi:serine/threonine protein kinase
MVPSRLSDIKPENLLFERIPIIPSRDPIIRQNDEEKEDEGEFVPGVGGGGIGRVKIADFGLSKVIWNEETMTPCGTVGYTAPEIVKDERYSKSVDMWALGCVLYTLLCGFPPFYDESINVLTEKVARGYYTFLSPWWDDVGASGLCNGTFYLVVHTDVGKLEQPRISSRTCSASIPRSVTQSMNFWLIHGATQHQQHRPYQLRVRIISHSILRFCTPFVEDEMAAPLVSLHSRRHSTSRTLFIGWRKKVLVGEHTKAVVVQVRQGSWLI